jgi:hypothetical protein
LRDHDEQRIAQHQWCAKCRDHRRGAGRNGEAKPRLDKVS